MRCTSSIALRVWLSRQGLEGAEGIASDRSEAESWIARPRSLAGDAHSRCPAFRLKRQWSQFTTPLEFP